MAKRDLTVDSILDEILSEREGRGDDGKFSFAGNEYSCLVVDESETAVPAKKGIDFGRSFPGVGEFMSRDVSSEAETPLSGAEAVDADEQVEDFLDDDDEEVFDGDEDEEFFDEDEEFFDDDEEFYEMLQKRYSGGKKHKWKWFYRGKRVRRSRRGIITEPIRKENGFFEKAKSFFKDNVIPLFMEEPEYAADTAEEEVVEIVGEPVEVVEEADVTEEDIAEERKSVKEIISSAGIAILGFGKSIWNVFQEKVINPIVEKVGNDDDYDYYDETEENSEPERPVGGTLHIVKSEYKREKTETTEEFFEVEEKPKSSLKQRIEEFFARDINFDDEMADEVLPDEEEEPGFFEALFTLFSRDDDDFEDELVEEVEPKKVKKPVKEKASKKKFNFFEKIKGLIYDSDYQETESHEEVVAIDQEVFDEIMSEKQAEVARLNSDHEIIFVEADEFPDAEPKN